VGRDRCLFCDRFLFDGDAIARPPALGLPVHRQCYLRDVGLESTAYADQNGSPEEDGEADD
jgi:hypothetical protein